MCHSLHEVCFVFKSSMVLHQFEAAGNIDRLWTAGVEDLIITPTQYLSRQSLGDA
jgi:hypothetical protein